MSYKYGYGKLEDELISLFRSGAPDFTVSKRILPSSQTFSATAASTPQEFILSLPAMNTVSVWKTCG